MLQFSKHITKTVDFKILHNFHWLVSSVRAFVYSNKACYLLKRYNLQVYVVFYILAIGLLLP